MQPGMPQGFGHDRGQAVLRPAGQPGQRVRELRDLRASRDPQDDGAHAAVPPEVTATLAADVSGPEGQAAVRAGRGSSAATTDGSRPRPAAGARTSSRPSRARTASPWCRRAPRPRRPAPRSASWCSAPRRTERWQRSGRGRRRHADRRGRREAESPIARRPPSAVSDDPRGRARHLIAGTRKGNPIEAARIAGLMGVKRTPDLLPFCHPIAVTGAEVVIEPDQAAGTIRVADRPSGPTTAPASRWRRSPPRPSPRSASTTPRRRSTARRGSTACGCSRSRAARAATTASD